MHELAVCTVEVEGAVRLDGYVREFADGVMWIGSQNLVRGFTEGERVVLRVLDDQRGECVYGGVVGRMSADLLGCAQVELLSTLQKRAVARVQVHVECEGWVRFPDGADVPDDEAADIDPETGERRRRFTVLDVSAHGMRMMAMTALPIGSLVRFVFPELSEAFWLHAEVVRAQPSRSGTHYGCQFRDASPRELDDLFSYVLRTQGALRRQQMLSRE
ncbi:PilZ domain-containing protein [Cellulomonas sp. NPDC089187]|uniref:PilZ domain-containing protein n=1 Tax=Cellulomonas sp. NPDC089187 TaxID=3154970 RepID=UPI00342F7A6F